MTGHKSLEKLIHSDNIRFTKTKIKRKQKLTKINSKICKYSIQCCNPSKKQKAKKQSTFHLLFRIYEKYLQLFTTTMLQQQCKANIYVLFHLHYMYIS